MCEIVFALDVIGLFSDLWCSVMKLLVIVVSFAIVVEGDYRFEKSYLTN